MGTRLLLSGVHELGDMVVIDWNTQGIPKEYPRNTQGIPKEYPRNTQGLTNREKWEVTVSNRENLGETGRNR